MKLFPSSKVEAELNYLEFHNTKGSLANGTYRVIEVDGDVSYAVLGDRRGTLFFDIKWFTEAEYESAIQEQAYAQRQDAFFDRDLEEDLMDSWDIAMIAEEGRRADEIPFDDHDLEGERWNQMIEDMVTEVSHALDDARAVCAEVAADKSIGDLLREFYVSQENQQ